MDAFRRWLILAPVVGAACWPTDAQSQTDAPPAPPAEVRVSDHPWDGGDVLDVEFPLSADDRLEAGESPVARYLITRSGEYGGLYEAVGRVVPTDEQRDDGQIRFSVEKCITGEPYYFRVYAVAHDGAKQAFAETTEPAVSSRQWFAGDRLGLAVITFVLCGAVVFYIVQARRGKELFIRKIPGLEVVEEAVGRATEMGRPCLFVPGALDMNDIQTIAALNILSRVAKVAAEYGAKVEVPTSRSLVMTTARETVESAYLAAGQHDAYNDDLIYYVTDEQFGFVAYASGLMVRERPAACFYMGSFFAESLIFAETGNSIGAIQVAGTAQTHQLPFFVAACDYTLIGEEFFAASAYLSGDADQLGSLKGQDVGKLLVGLLLIVGCLLATYGTVLDHERALSAVEFLRNTVLK